MLRKAKDLRSGDSSETWTAIDDARESGTAIFVEIKWTDGEVVTHWWNDPEQEVELNEVETIPE